MHILIALKRSPSRNERFGLNEMFQIGCTKYLIYLFLTETMPAPGISSKTYVLATILLILQGLQFPTLKAQVNPDLRGQVSGRTFIF